MPTYEYACTSCRRRFEIVQSFSDDALTTCEECGGALKRVFHPVGVVLKGSGFYATDNRSAKALAPKSEKGEKGDGGSKSESTSGSKDASKPAKKDGGSSGSSSSSKPGA